MYENMREPPMFSYQNPRGAQKDKAVPDSELVEVLSTVLRDRLV